MWFDWEIEYGPRDIEPDTDWVIRGIGKCGHSLFVDVHRGFADERDLVEELYADLINRPDIVEVDIYPTPAD